MFLAWYNPHLPLTNLNPFAVHCGATIEDCHVHLWNHKDFPSLEEIEVGKEFLVDGDLVYCVFNDKGQTDAWLEKKRASAV